MTHDELKDELAKILASNTCSPSIPAGPIPVHAIGDNPIPAFLTNTPRAGETAEQTAARYNRSIQAPGHTDLMVSPEAVDDAINHPTHYSRWAMEPIEFIAVNDLPWWVANVVKYCMRFDAKDGLQDMYKARSYLDMKIRQLEGVPEFWKQPNAA